MTTVKDKVFEAIYMEATAHILIEEDLQRMCKEATLVILKILGTPEASWDMAYDVWKRGRRGLR